MDAFEEADKFIAQADSVKKSATLADDKVFARNQGNFLYTDSENINFIDLSPKQLFRYQQH